MRQLIIDIEKLKHNIRYLVEFCHNNNVEMTGIMKGPGFNRRIIGEFLANGVDTLGFSRLPLKDHGIDPPPKDAVYISLASMQDIQGIVRLFDISYHSQLSVIKMLNEHLLALNGKLMELMTEKANQLKDT